MISVRIAVFAVEPGIELDPEARRDPEVSDSSSIAAHGVTDRLHDKHQAIGTQAVGVVESAMAGDLELKVRAERILIPERDGIGGESTAALASSSGRQSQDTANLSRISVDTQFADVGKVGEGKVGSRWQAGGHDRECHHDDALANR